MTIAATLEIKVSEYSDLSPEEQAEQPSNGAGKEYASYLRILHNGETIGIYSDAMEPEAARGLRMAVARIVAERNHGDKASKPRRKPRRNAGALMFRYQLSLWRRETPFG